MNNLYVLDHINSVKLIKSDFALGLILIKVINGGFYSSSNNNYFKRRLIKPIYCNLCLENDTDYLSETFTFYYSDNFIDLSNRDYSIKGLQINPNSNELQVLGYPKINNNLQNIESNLAQLSNQLDNLINNNLGVGGGGFPPELI